VNECRVECDVNIPCASARRTMDHRRAVDEDRISMLETVLRETSEAATECERKYEEVCHGTSSLIPMRAYARDKRLSHPIVSIALSHLCNLIPRPHCLHVEFSTCSR